MKNIGKFGKAIKKTISKILYGSGRTAIFKKLMKEAERHPFAKELTAETGLPKAILGRLKGVRVYKIQKLKDGRIKVWGMRGGDMLKCGEPRRYIFSAGENPILLKKTKVNEIFATSTVHKGPVSKGSIDAYDSGFSVVRRMNDNLKPAEIDGFRTTREVIFGKSSEWQDVTEHISFSSLKKDKGTFSKGEQFLDILPIYNDKPNLQSKPIWGSFGRGQFYPEKPLSLQEVLSFAKHHEVPPVTSKRNIYIMNSASCEIPALSLDGYRRYYLSI